MPAGDVMELSDLFNMLPPPLKKEKIEFSEILIKNNYNEVVESVTLQRWNEITKCYGTDKYTVLGYIDEDGKRIKEDGLLSEKPKPPKSYLIDSILVTLLCCMPFGIVGIINAATVESKYYAGDIEGANHASKEAKKWTNIGLWCGLAGAVIYFIFMAFSLVLGVA